MKVQSTKAERCRPARICWRATGRRPQWNCYRITDTKRETSESELAEALDKEGRVCRLCWWGLKGTKRTAPTTTVYQTGPFGRELRMMLSDALDAAASIWQPVLKLDKHDFIVIYSYRSLQFYLLHQQQQRNYVVRLQPSVTLYFFSLQNLQIKNLRWRTLVLYYRSGSILARTLSTDDSLSTSNVLTGLCSSASTNELHHNKPSCHLLTSFTFYSRIPQITLEGLLLAVIDIFMFSYISSRVHQTW